ncbi:MAG: lysostaphin resistance A-like protein [Eubacteriales bacterium]
MDSKQNQPNSNPQPNDPPTEQQQNGQPYFDHLYEQWKDGQPNGVQPVRPLTGQPTEQPTGQSIGQPDSGAETVQVPQKEKRFEENPVIAILKAFGYFLIYLGVSVLLMLVFEIIWVISLASQSLSTEQIQTRVNVLGNQNAMLITVVADILVLAIFALILVCRRKNPLSGKQNRELFNRVPLLRIGYLILMGFFLNFAVVLIIGMASRVLPEWMLEETGQTQEVYSGGGIFIYILGGVILAPIVEEFVMRGLMAKRFSRGMPKWLAVLVAAVIFGCIHDAVIQKIYAGLLGILLGAVFFRENSLFASVAVHFGFNLASLLPYVIELLGYNESDPVMILFIEFCLICFPISILMTALYFAILSKKKQQYTGVTPATGANLSV